MAKTYGVCTNLSFGAIWKLILIKEGPAIIFDIKLERGDSIHTKEDFPNGGTSIGGMVPKCAWVIKSQTSIK